MPVDHQPDASEGTPRRCLHRVLDDPQTQAAEGLEHGTPAMPVIYSVVRSDWPELSQLPGIGEALARRIVESREADGPFADHQQLRRVRGIGPRTLERSTPYLRPVAETANVAGR